MRAMDKYVYGIYSNEDQLDNNDRLYNKVNGENFLYNSFGKFVSTWKFLASFLQ